MKGGVRGERSSQPPGHTRGFVKGRENAPIRAILTAEKREGVSDATRCSSACCTKRRDGAEGGNRGKKAGTRM